MSWRGYEMEWVQDEVSMGWIGDRMKRVLYGVGN